MSEFSELWKHQITQHALIVSNSSVMKLDTIWKKDSKVLRKLVNEQSKDVTCHQSLEEVR